MLTGNGLRRTWIGTLGWLLAIFTVWGSVRWIAGNAVEPSAIVKVMIYLFIVVAATTAAFFIAAGQERRHEANAQRAQAEHDREAQCGPLGRTDVPRLAVGWLDFAVGSAIAGVGFWIFVTLENLVELQALTAIAGITTVLFVFACYRFEAHLSDRL